MLYSIYRALQVGMILNNFPVIIINSCYIRDRITKLPHSVENILNSERTHIYSIYLQFLLLKKEFHRWGLYDFFRSEKSDSTWKCINLCQLLLGLLKYLAWKNSYLKKFRMRICCDYYFLNNKWRSEIQTTSILWFIDNDLTKNLIGT